MPARSKSLTGGLDCKPPLPNPGVRPQVPTSHSRDQTEKPVKRSGGVKTLPEIRLEQVNTAKERLLSQINTCGACDKSRTPDSTRYNPAVVPFSAA